MQDQTHVREIKKTTKSFGSLKKYCESNNLPIPLKTTASGVYTIHFGGINHLVYKI